MMAMDSILNFVFALVILLCPCSAVISKACYGAEGLPCTSHRLTCSSGRIAIKDAFYMNSTDCLYVGTDCGNIIVSNMEFTYPKYNFSDTELDSLYSTCSSKSKCSLPAGRTSERIGAGFSAIIYQCIGETTLRSTEANTTRTTATAAATTTATATHEPTVAVSSQALSGSSSIVPSDQTTQTENGTETTLRSTTANTTRTTATATATQEPTAAVSSQTLSGSSSIFPSDKTTQTENGTDAAQTTSPISNNDTGDSEQQGTDTGTVVGIVIPICIIIAGVVIAVIILRKRKLRRKDKNGNVTKRKSKPQQIHSLEKKSSPDYDYATTNECLDLVPKAHNMPAPLKCTSVYDYAGKNANHDVKPQQLSTTSDYDYAPCGDKQTNHDNPSSRNTQTRDIDYDHIGRQPARANGHYDTSLSVDDTLKGGKAKDEVYGYTHLNDKVSSNADVDSTYNTTSSPRHKMDSSTNDMEDDYGYNHLGTETKKNLPQNEYDTTASAIRDVSRMNGDIEDSTYDHAHLITSGCSSSGMTNTGFQESDYDHASPLNTANKDEYEFHASPNGNPQEDGGTDAYTLAREAEANPYQLTK